MRLTPSVQAQVEDSYSKQKKKKELQIEVEELRKRLTEMDNIRESVVHLISSSDIIFS